MISSLIIQIVAQLHLQIHPSFIGAICLVPFGSALGPQMCLGLTRHNQYRSSPGVGILTYFREEALYPQLK
jgi:hypothetical protein